jgi:trehalose 6-phosphate phosphatase
VNEPLPIESPEAKRAIEALRGARTLYAFDYDGTLAPFVLDPSQALMDAATADALRALVAAKPVAVITGRSLATIRRLLPVEPAFLVGNHGVEGLSWEPELLKGCADMVRTWQPRLAAALAERGDVRLEDKTYSLSAHFRGSPDPDGARRLVLAAIEALEPRPRPIGGVDVVNLVPPGAPHKGAALRKLLEDNAFERALYVGDDLTDEDVFENAGPEVMTVRVACRPAKTAARFMTTLPAMAAWLRELAR